jgi:hypothetical protein
MQHQRGRSCKHNGVVNAKETLDLIIVTEDYLQDGGSIIVIHLHQVLVKSTILEYCVEYNFETHKK